MACWSELPGPCLQVISSHIVSASDIAAARLSCANWSHGFSLQHISLNLSSSNSSSSSSSSGRSSSNGAALDLDQRLQRAWEMLACIQQRSRGCSAAYAASA
ncbi:hypothetical protein OEZ86_010579 [Tetradesmus obliquus]|nr:hypothetical protein OEZ86_010579 [Tetradesmus obliquus]